MSLTKNIMKKTTLIIISLFVVTLSAMIPIRGTDIWYVQYVALFIVLSLGVSYALWKFNKYLSLLTIVCLYSAMIVVKQSPKAMLMLIQLDLGCLAMYVISNLKQNQREVILKSMLGLVVIQGIMVTLQTFNLDPIFNHIADVTKDDTVGFSGSRNQLGIFFAVTSPIVISYCIWLIPFTIIGLFGSTTSTAWGAFIITGAYIISRKYKRMVWIFLVVTFILGGIFLTKFETLNMGTIKPRLRLVRLTIWQVLTEEARMVKKEFKVARNQDGTEGDYGTVIKRKVKCNKYFGYGLGSFQKISPYTQDAEIWDGVSDHVYGHAHNDYAEFMFETGIIGAVILFLAIMSFFIRFWKAKKTKILTVSFACILAQMLCSMGVFTVHTACNGMILIVLIGIFEGELKWDDFQTGTKVKC